MLINAVIAGYSAFKFFEKRNEENTISARETNGFGSVTVIRDGKNSVDEYINDAREALYGRETSGTEYTNQDEINQALWDAADTDGDGYLNKEEYENLASRFTEPNWRNVALNYMTSDRGARFWSDSEMLDKLLEADKDIDANGDGKINRDEFNNSFLNYILTGEKTLDEVIAEQDVEETAQQGTEEPQEITIDDVQESLFGAEEDENSVEKFTEDCLD